MIDRYDTDDYRDDFDGDPRTTPVRRRNRRRGNRTNQLHRAIRISRRGW